MRDGGIVHVPDEGLPTRPGPGESRSVALPADTSTSPRLRDRIDRVLIPESPLLARVRSLARQIAHDYAAASRLTLLVILDGAFVFAADLGRELYRAGGPEVGFVPVKARTYGDEIRRAGEDARPVQLLLAPDRLDGRDVLLVEDIVDQGTTLMRITEAIRERGVRSLRICTLLEKRLQDPEPEARDRRRALEIAYVGFSVPDRWVAGYGIDAAGDFRQLPFVVAVNEAFYLDRQE